MENKSQKMAPPMPSSDRYRSMFNDLKRDLNDKKKSYDPNSKLGKSALSQLNSVIITYGFLRFETALTGSPTNFSFNTIENQGNTFVTEKRLSINDEFVVMDQGFYLTKVGTTTAPTDAERVIGQLHTFPNSTIFSAANEAANLQIIYNSSLSITIQSKVYIQQNTLLDYYRVGEAQQGIQLSQQAAAVGTNGAYLRSAWNQTRFGALEVTPSYKLSGASKNDINIDTPGNVGALLTGTNSQNVLVMMVWGFLKQNASTLNKM